MRNKKAFLLSMDFVLLLLLLWFDQWTKKLAVTHLKEQPPFVLWDGVLELHYLENRGAAFGILQNQKVFFLAGAFCVLGFVFYCLVKLPATKRYGLLHPLGAMLAAGGLGNMVDRIAHEYVVDFIYFKLIDYPIFNVADIYVCVSVFLLAVLYLWKCTDADMALLRPKWMKKKADGDSHG